MTCLKSTVPVEFEIRLIILWLIADTVSAMQKYMYFLYHLLCVYLLHFAFFALFALVVHIRFNFLSAVLFVVALFVWFSLFSFIRGFPYKCVSNFATLPMALFRSLFLSPFHLSKQKPHHILIIPLHFIISSAYLVFILYLSILN